MNNTENEQVAEPTLDNNDHPQPNVVKDDNQMETAILKKTEKLAKLVKLNFVITIIGLGTLGYLHFSDKSSIDESLAKSKIAIKQEIGKELASKEALQNLSTDLTTKMDGLGARVSGLEVQDEQYQEEFQKLAVLNARVSELQASMKKSKSSTKSEASDSTKGKSKTKSSSKSSKKGKK